MARKPSTASPIGNVSLRQIDQSSADGTTDYLLAVVMLGVSVLMPWYFEIPVSFDITSRDFNPLIVASVVFAGIGLVTLYRCVGDTLRIRKFGVSRLGGTSVLSGNTFRGVIFTSFDLAPTGDYKVTLKCLSRITFRNPGIDDKRYTSDKVMSKETRTIEAGSVKSSQGIPVEFQISAGLPPAQKGKTADIVSVRWVLTISAPMPGLNYFARFSMHVDR